MVDYLELLKEFHVKYNHHIQDRPHWPPAPVVTLRSKLIEEEAREFCDASTNGNLIDIADSLGDLLYVTFGAALSYGIPIEEVFIEIHHSNMTKSMEKDEKSIKGKTIKGENYSPPNIRGVLDKFMRGKHAKNQ